MQMDGKTVVITGASRGIGKSTAEVLAQAGANVVLTARSQDAISSIADSIGGNALAISCDVGQFDQLQNVVELTKNAFGPVDVLINNAGVVEPIAHMAQADPTAWAEVININLNGVFFGMRAVLPGMIARGSGTILTVSSGAAHNPVEAWSHYCASKAGAAMLTRTLDLEYRGRGIRAIGLSPGTVATEMQRQIKASGINPVSQLDWSAHIPADWPAHALHWMCTEAADPYLGTEISLRDESIRRAIGLID
ncbi:MAG: SDR family oxidoreductase [Rhodobacteraceae bacterium]|nr:SDR family oxidoreductase [Paracoccaceae bacterium]